VEKCGRAGQAGDDNIMRRMRSGCWVIKFTETHSYSLILIAFPRQRWLCERAAMLRYRYIACLVQLYVCSMAGAGGGWGGGGRERV